MSLLEITNSSKQIASNVTFNYKISKTSIRNNSFLEFLRIAFILKKKFFFETFVESKKRKYIINNFLSIFLRKKKIISI